MPDELALALGDRAFEEHIDCEMTIVDCNTGKVSAFTSRDIDREMAADRRILRQPARHRRATPVIRRSIRRVRSQLRSGRPCSRRSSSRVSASSGDPDLPDDPEPPRAALLSYGCLTPAQRGEESHGQGGAL